MVERNLNVLVAAGRRVSVRVTVTDSTLEWMEETIRLARRLGVATVHFEPRLAGRTVRCHGGGKARCRWRQHLRFGHDPATVPMR